MGNKISVCLLVNYETTLRRCLESVKNIADELIVVDTSPNLINKKVALQFTDKYFGFKWTNNFSDARNFSIWEATGDWIIFIDPDEYVVNPQSIRENLQADVDAYFLKLYDLNSEGKVLSKDKIIRLFKNKKGFKFSGNIHEFLVDKDRVPVKKSRLLKGPVIYHTGYSNDEIMEKKFSRNFKLLEVEIKKFPDRKDAYFYLARNYFNQARFLILKKGKVTNAAVVLLKKSIWMSMRYTPTIGDGKFKTEAKKMYDLSVTILSFQNSKAIRKLIY